MEIQEARTEKDRNVETRNRNIKETLKQSKARIGRDCHLIKITLEGNFGLLRFHDTQGHVYPRRRSWKHLETT